MGQAATTWPASANTEVRMKGASVAYLTSMLFHVNGGDVCHVKAWVNGVTTTSSRPETPLLVASDTTALS